MSADTCLPRTSRPPQGSYRLGPHRSRCHALGGWVATMAGPMSRSLRLRKWQKEALDLLAERDPRDFLAVATPGAGKTTFALAASLQHLAAHPDHRLVVVAPTSHLKHQWTHAASRFGLQLDPQWVSASGRLPADMHGIVVT